MIEFKDLLLQTPKNRHQRFPGASIHESVRRNVSRPDPCPTLDQNTINGRYLGHLKSILGWCVANGIIERSPADRIRVARSKRPKKKRYPFNASHLQAIFSAPMFTTDAPRDAKFWAVLIAAFSGLRASEIAQLETADIVKTKGIWCFQITEWSDDAADYEDPDKSLKTGAAAHRHVPIHPELLKIGLLDRLNDAKEAREKRLLFDWIPNRSGDYTQTVPRWFNRTFLPSVGIDRPELTFHSFRHTFKDAARNAGVPKDVHDRLTGHAESDASDGYGDGHDVTVLSAHMARIRLDPLDLCRFYGVPDTTASTVPAVSTS